MKSHAPSRLTSWLKRNRLTTLIALLVSVLALNARIDADTHAPNLQAIQDKSGEIQTFSSTGSLDLNSAFFKNLGTNGRTCASCHQPADGWTVTPEHIQARFDIDGGLDPIFRPNDGANCPTADVSTVDARRASYSMLLSKGLIRVSLPVPANAEFTLAEVSDPYSCATAADLSLYRRPLPSTNLRFLSTVMWDGRETAPGQAILDDLKTQAKDATLGHAQGAVGSPTVDQIQDIVNFEMSLSTAQSRDNDAGVLNAQNGNGGPKNLSNQKFYLGINDVLGADPTGAAFNPEAITLYKAWANLNSSDHDRFTAARESVARGEALFNSLPIPIRGVGGLNDNLNQPLIMGTCTTCHDSPNVGNHSVTAPLNIGLVDPSRRTADLPLYTFRNKLTGKTIQVTDPGRALISGRWVDIGKFKGAILRGLAARAPYFHNGSAATLDDAVDFYNTRFELNLTDQQKTDLVAFLKTL